MAVGVIIGLTVGPKSTLLEHDLYTLTNPAKAPLYLEKEKENSESSFRLVHQMPFHFT